MIDTGAIRLRWEADGSKRDERGKRVFAASEARAAGWGGVAAVAEITGLARSRIIRGLKDLNEPALEPGRIRRAGGGRHRVTATDRTLLGELRRLVEPATMGDPMRPLTWVSKSREPPPQYQAAALSFRASPRCRVICGRGSMAKQFVVLLRPQLDDDAHHDGGLACRSFAVPVAATVYIID
jgi:hypothetical protein